MPRTRKTQTGKPAMPVTTVQGQPYGEGVAQRQMQQAMPAPQQRQTPPVDAAPTPVVAATRPPVDPRAAAAALRDRVGVFGPATNRPAEPVTSGLTTGPGPGPEALVGNRRSPLGETMRMVARQSGNDFLARLADQANL